MKPLALRTPSGTTQIEFGDARRLKKSRDPSPMAVFVTDRKVFGLYRPFFAGRETAFVGRGEGSKTLEMVNGLFKRFLRLGIGRGATIVAVGGGVVCDVSGLAAALYLRGIGLVLVPTTLLAQADASVGGKNGVNFERYKNLIGTIRQPERILIDPGFLKTLPPREVRNGLAEIVKAAAIGDAEMFRDLEKAAERAPRLDPAVILEFVRRALRIKIAVVERDELETGPRRLLNFGHTLGHALERSGGFGHGEAVSVGMCAAARVAEGMRLVPGAETKRLVRLLRAFGLPTAAPGTADRVLGALGRDKKRAGEVIHFVMPSGGMGSATVRPMPLGELKERLRAVC